MYDNYIMQFQFTYIRCLIILTEHLSDSVLTKVAKELQMDPQTLGKDLKLDYDTVAMCIHQHPDDITGQCCAVLMEWRETDAVIGHGEKALDYLKSLGSSSSK